MAVKINLRLLPTMLVVFLITAGCSTKPKGPVEVRINANEFSFESSLREFETGVIYRFTVTNTGKLAHEIMIVPPTESGMLMDMEQIDQTALAMIPEDDLPAGAT